MHVILWCAAALLAVCRAADVNRVVHVVDIGNGKQIELPAKGTNKQVFSVIKRPKPFYELLQGDNIHLQCEAIGTPAPSVRWFKNDAPIFEYDMESNEVIDSSPTSMARVTSTLLVTKSSGRDKYTCLIIAGAKNARFSTVVYSKNGVTDLSERSKLYPLSPQVVVWYKVFADMIGNNVLIPCRAKGHPRPRITWRDNTGNLVKNNPRMQVLRSGELLISALRWSDLGEFSCHATNVYGSAVANTFVYPAKAN